MSHHRYLIVGGGMTADAAVRGIRSADEEGSIGVVGEEPHPPYDRPPLSKGLWKGGDEERIWRGTDELKGVKLHLERRIERIDREERTATDERGTVYSYEKLLLATGGSPRTLDDAPPQVNYFRSYEDYRNLRAAADAGARFAVIGGGFIGSEVAAALAMNDREVVLLFPEEGICGRVLPRELSLRLNDRYRDEGVDVRPGSMVASVQKSGSEFLVAVEESEERAIRVDAVVGGLGIVPNTTLAEAAELEVDDGIAVNAAFRTDDPHIWAAGDVAAYWSPVLGKRVRVEHEDHANGSGMVAGRSMAGEEVEYDHIPLFYSDLFDVSYEAVGELDPSETETVAAWDEPGERGVVYYHRGGRVQGVLLWNLRGKVRDARKVMRDRTFHDAEEMRRLIELESRVPGGS